MSQPTCCQYVFFNDIPIGDEFLVKIPNGNEIRYKKITNSKAESVGRKKVKSFRRSYFRK